MLVPHTKRRWTELGMVDRGVVSLIWILLLASIAAIAMTIWRYVKAARGSEEPVERLNDHRSGGAGSAAFGCVGSRRLAAWSMMAFGSGRSG